MKNQINIYIGTGPGMEKACDTLVCSIYENCSNPERLQIHLMEAWGEDREWRWWHGQMDPRDDEMHGKGYWVTPFTMFRYAIPYVQESGYAIYFDADMIVLGDVCRLYEFREEGKWACAANRDGDCVMVMDVTATKNDKQYPPFDQLKGGLVDKHAMRRIASRHMVPNIPEAWNRHAGDYEPGNAQLVHYTDIKTQPMKPWPHLVKYEPLQNAAAQQLWEEWSERAEAWQLKSA